MPFLLIGDSPQALVANVSLKDVERFLSNREKAGFNAVWVNLLCNSYTGGRKDGTTYDGIAPFRIPGNLSTPNEAYFRRVDAIVRIAAKHGIAVFLDPIETGGWLPTLAKNGIARNAAYGRYLGKRYRKFPNLVWLNGDDYYRWPDPSWDALVLAVARGIRATDHVHIQTVQLSENPSLVDPRWAPLIQLDAIYTYAPAYAQILTEYNRPNFLPIFTAETNYELERNIRAQTLRRQEYWTMLSGATGLLYGNHYTWQFPRGWKAHLSTKGVEQLRHMSKLFAGRPWFELIPDQNHVVVTERYGTFTTTGTVNDSDYVTTARSPDGALAISYLPTLHSIVVNMAEFSGPVQAHWYDPASGTYVAIPGSPFPSSGEREFTPLGRNADGDGDWVLVLAAA